MFLNNPTASSNTDTQNKPLSAETIEITEITETTDTEIAEIAEIAETAETAKATEATVETSSERGTSSSNCASSPQHEVKIDNTILEKSQKNDISELDESVAETEIAKQSEEGYRKLSEKIVSIIDDYLKRQDTGKEPLRKSFVPFFKNLLILQYIVLAVWILWDSCYLFPFRISETVLHIYIVSVFLETLSTIGVMIAFAFSTKEESTIVSVLTTIIENYQKYTLPSKYDNDKDKHN